MPPQLPQERLENPIVDEVRELRRQASERCGHDLDRVAKRLREIEALHRDRVVQPPPSEHSARPA